MSLDDLYRKVIMEHYKNPKNMGEIANSQVVSLNNPVCGDTIFLYFQKENNIIKDIKFKGEGCSISLASASMMTEALKGLPFKKAFYLIKLFFEMMKGKKVATDEFCFEDIKALEGVVKFPTRIKCATLAWKALEKGLKEESN